MNILESKELYHDFSGLKVLFDVNLQVKAGERHAIIGPNGAGKSTMMKIITGFIPASSGKVIVNGLDVEADNPEVKNQIGYLPENNPLYPEMYVREYLGFVASIYKSAISSKNLTDNIIELIKARETARQVKDFAKADKLRQQIEAQGYLIKDSANGSTLMKK